VQDERLLTCAGFRLRVTLETTEIAAHIALTDQAKRNAIFGAVLEAIQKLPPILPDRTRTDPTGPGIAVTCDACKRTLGTYVPEPGEYVGVGGPLIILERIRWDYPWNAIADRRLPGAPLSCPACNTAVVWFWHVDGRGFLSVRGALGPVPAPSTI